jgi:hypothetical protein
MTVVDHDRLGVAGERAAGGAVAGVADCDLSAEEREVLLIEYLRDETHARPHTEIFSVAGGYPGAFLAAMLKCVKSVERESSDIFARCIDTKHAAGFSGAVVFGDQNARFPSGHGGR